MAEMVLVLQSSAQALGCRKLERFFSRANGRLGRLYRLPRTISSNLEGVFAKVPSVGHSRNNTLLGKNDNPASHPPHTNLILTHAHTTFVVPYSP